MGSCDPHSAGMAQSLERATGGREGGREEGRRGEGREEEGGGEGRGWRGGRGEGRRREEGNSSLGLKGVHTFFFKSENSKYFCLADLHLHKH